MATPRTPTAQLIALHEGPDATVPPRTQALLKADSLELVHLALPAGARLPEHAAPGEITLQGLQGRLLLQLRSRTLLLGPGDLVHLAAGEPHAVHALADSRALLTLCLHRPSLLVGPAAPQHGDGGLRHPRTTTPTGAAAGCSQPRTTP
jgi:quercetin dioxygenase-like cupin family protein